MALQMWLPLNGDLHNQGLSNVVATNNGATIENNGKIGKCYKTSINGSINLNYNGNQVNNTSFSFGGWFKFNQSEISTAISGKTYTSNATAATGNLIGNNSYGGISLQWQSNNMYANNNFSSISVCSYLRTSTNGARATSFFTLPFDTWVHIFLTYDKIKNLLGLWIDGQLKYTSNQVAFTDAPNRNLTINFGGIAGGNGPSAKIPFFINDVRIYDHALSATEIEEIARGLVLHYKLDDQFCESTTNLVTREDGLSNTCYNGATGKYNYGTNTDMYKIIGNFNNLNCTKVYMGTAGLQAYPYVYFDAFNAKGTEIQTLSFDYYPTTQTIIIPYSYNGSYNFSYTVDNTISDSKQNVSYIGIPVKTNQWNHIIITAQKYDTTNTNRGIGYIRIGAAAHTSATTNYWLFANVQVENKNHATGYAGINSSRAPTTIYDCSGYQNNGTIIGSLSTVIGGPRYNINTFFNGENSCIQVPYNQACPENIFTINLWFCKDALGSKNYETLFGGPSGFEMDTRLRSATTLSLYMASTRGGNVFSSFNFNEWYMVTMVRDGTNELYYINGELKKTIEAKSMPTGNYFIGAWQTAVKQNYYGNMSDFRIYATALSAAAIKELYTTSLKIVSGNPVARELSEL